MKCILIITVYSGADDVWGLAQTQNRIWKADENKLSCPVGGNEVIIFKQADESRDGEGDLTDACIREAKKTIERLQIQKAEIFIAAHGTTKHELTQWTKRKNIKASINSFSHEDTDEIYKVLKTLAEAPTQANFDLTHAEIKKKRQLTSRRIFNTALTGS